jgi:photosystem II stability/assembly factor-like uncharacterized protein
MSAVITAGLLGGGQPAPTVSPSPVPQSSPLVTVPPPDEPVDDWYVLPIRSQAQWERYESSRSLLDVGGEGAQHNHAITRSAADPDRIYTAGDVHQVRRSDDGGRTWRSPRNVGLTVTYMYAIAADPVDPDVVFVHGVAGSDTPVSDQGGLFRSADGGESWERVLPLPGWRTEQRSVSHSYVIPDPRPGTRSAQGARVWYAAIDDEGGNPDAYLYRSTDGGQSWEPGVDLGELGVGNLRTLAAGTTTDGLVLYLAADSGVWVSEDGGSSFRRADGDGLPGTSVVELAVDPSDSGRLYVLARDGRLYRSDDGARSFVPLSWTMSGGGTPSYEAAHIVAHPTRPGRLYVIPVSASDPVLTSVDGGESWRGSSTEPSDGLMPEYQVSVSGGLSGLAPAHDDPDDVVAYSRATLWASADGGQSWAPSAALYTGFTWDGVQSASFDPEDPERFAFFVWDVSSIHTATGGDYFRVVTYRDDYPHNFLTSGDVQPGTDGQRIMVATLGRDYALSDDGGRRWTLIDSDLEANRSFVLFHRTDPEVLYAGRNVSRDGGGSWARLDDGRFILDVADGDNDVVFTSRLGDSPSVRRSTDAGRTWTELFPDGLADSSGGLVTTLRGHDATLVFASHPTDPDVFFTKTSYGDVVRYDAADGTWTPLGVISDPANDGTRRYVRFIEVDPQDPQIIYVALKNSGGDVVHRSTDGGQTWTDITGTLPRSAVSPAIAVSPVTGDLFVGGTYTGTWVHPRPEGHPSTTPSYVTRDGFVRYGTLE